MGLLWAMEGQTDMPKYEFKVKPELVWALVVAAVVAVAEVLPSIGPEQLQDWNAVLVIVAGAVARAVGGKLLSLLSAPEAE